MFVTCQQMAAASASWLLALIIATALISTSAWRVRDGSVHVTCRDVVVVLYRAASSVACRWSQPRTSGAGELLWPSEVLNETNVYNSIAALH